LAPRETNDRRVSLWKREERYSAITSNLRESFQMELFEGGNFVASQ
jgi:hypothetical protein